MGVNIETRTAQEPDQCDAQSLGEADGQARRCRNRRDDRQTRDRGLLENLETGSTRNEKNPIRERRPTLEKFVANHFINGVVPTDVLSENPESSLSVENSGGVETARPIKRGLRVAERPGQADDDRLRNNRPRPDPRTAHGDLIERNLAAEAAT